MSLHPRAPFLSHLSQYDVDFVIPRLGVDIPLGIDPFLLYKSRDASFRELHSLLLALFDRGIAAVKKGDTAEARRLFDFPEVSAIGFGYTAKGKRGSGVGTYMSGVLVDTVAGSPALHERGVRHIEEMQLLSTGIGADRISDIAANVFKRFLIEYTQRQCALWNLELTGAVPIAHVYDPASGTWEDCYEDLPTSPIDRSPILFVPRRFVRVLPWINYDDFIKTEFSAYLAAKREGSRKHRTADQPASAEVTRAKQDVVTVTRADVALVDRYVRAREKQSAQAQPAIDYVDEDLCRQGEELKRKLAIVSVGRDQAAEYQRLVLEILNHLFAPDLANGVLEEKTLDGTERRDVIFTNESDHTFWDYIRTAHDGILVMFEVKNTDELDAAAINQTATYLGDRLGRFGVIVTRREPSDSAQRKLFSVWNDSGAGRKAILVLSDDNLRELLDLSCRSGSPTKWLQAHYRAFRTALQ